MKDCIFCKIARGESPCYKIYEDDMTIAFLDIAKDVYGHTLVIPKKHFENAMDCEDEVLASVIKTVRKDMKDYDKFAQTELPKIEEKLAAKKQIKLSSKQEKDAKLLQKNTSKVINNQREKLYEQSVGIKALSETILGPLDILATATGGYIGNKLSKTCPNKKFAGLLTGLGAVVAFIPAAIVEAKLTKQQKLSEKISVMLALKDMQDISIFADNNFKPTETDTSLYLNQSKLFGNFH